MKMQMQAVNHAWQPVTPTSPPWDGVPVLVWHAQGGIWISGRKKAQYAGMGYDWYLGNHRFPPTHWRPLPEPPVHNEENHDDHRSTFAVTR